MSLDECAYCGEFATGLDHVIPRSYISPVAAKKRSNKCGGEPGFKVPSCTQCNSILGDRIFKNLVDRKKYVHKRLMVKLHDDACAMYWSEDERRPLGGIMKRVIDKSMAKREIASRRLKYSGCPPDARWLRMEERWRLSYNQLELDVPVESLCRE